MAKITFLVCQTLTFLSYACLGSVIANDPGGLVLPGEQPLPFFIIYHPIGIARIGWGVVIEEGERGIRY
jgi:hypothetical protein